MEGNYIIKINSKCNSNCCFCADSTEIRARSDFDYNKLIQELEENRKKFDSLIISGGEPTIYKNILKYVKHAKNVCKYKQITITTNGFLLAYSDFVDELIDNGVDCFLISFATSDERMYDAITKVEGSFRYVTKGILNLKKRDNEVRTNTVLHKLNYKSIHETVGFLIDRGVDYIQLAFMNPIGSNIVNSKSVMQVTYTEVLPHIKDAFKIASEMNFNDLFIENIPICIAKEFMNKISDLRKPEINKDYYNAAKTKPEKCKKCYYFDICDGVWKAYIEQFGDNELKPIKNENKTNYASTLIY